MKEHNGTTHTFSKHLIKFLTYARMIVILFNAHLWHAIKMCGVPVGPANGDLWHIIFIYFITVFVNPNSTIASWFPQ